MRRALAVMLVLAGCVRSARPEGPKLLSAEEIAARIPEKVSDREGWARDLELALETNALAADMEHVCAAIAVVDQESGFQANPVVPNLAAIARKELKRKAEALGPLGRPLLGDVLAARAPGAKRTFDQRLSAVRTEADLDVLYRDLLSEQRRRHPIALAAADVGAALFSSKDLDERNPVTTAGSMQVGVAYAEEHARRLGRDPDRVRDELYTRQGGLLYGTARLFEGAEVEPVYRFADYNAGVYASRNAAFQEQVAALTGARLALDGDLLAYAPYREDTQTMRALLRVAGARARDVRLEKSDAFERTPTWEAVKAAWQAKFGKPAPYARLPDVTLSSPKLSRQLSTAWFARSVERRYRACLDRR